MPHIILSGLNNSEALRSDLHFSFPYLSFPVLKIERFNSILPHGLDQEQLDIIGSVFDACS